MRPRKLDRAEFEQSAPCPEPNSLEHSRRQHALKTPVEHWRQQPEFRKDVLVTAAERRPPQGEGKHGLFIWSHGHSHFENQVDRRAPCGASSKPLLRVRDSPPQGDLSTPFEICLGPRPQRVHATPRCRVRPELPSVARCRRAIRRPERLGFASDQGETLPLSAVQPGFGVGAQQRQQASERTLRHRRKPESRSK